MASTGAGASRVGINTANSAYFMLRPTTTASKLYIKQIIVGVSVAPTTAPAFYLSRASAIGTVTTTLAGQPLDPGESAGIGTLDSVWSVAPTFSTTNWIQTGGLAVTAGGAFVWTFYDEPLIVDRVTTTGLVVANNLASGATTGTFTCSMLWDE